MNQQTLAIFSPNKTAISETFIQTLKNLSFKIKYYYGGYIPTQLEGRQTLLKFSLSEKIKRKFSKKFRLYEYALLYSLKREKVDCVLAQYGPTASESLHIIKALGLPLVVQFYGFDTSEYEITKKYRDGYMKVFEYAKAITVVSKKMFDQLVTMGCPSTKIHIIVCSANPIFFTIKSLTESNQFMALGRFVDKKAPYLTLASFKKVLEVCPTAKLIMGGEGELLNTCINLTKVWKMNGNVQFKGNLTPEEVMKYFESSLAFVQHSIIALTGDSEGTPVAILEAMAAGLPIISTNHAGIPEIVTNNETGLLSDEQDVDAMANNMILLIKNKEVSKKLSSNAKTYAEKHFTSIQYLQKLNNLINIAIAN